MKTDLKNLAINLRRDGFTYSEILAKVPVAKSTLSLWLRSVALAKRQQQRLTKKKLAAIQKGAAAKHQQRLNLVKKINEESKKEVRELNNTHLWLAGIMLYWAEGAKEKEHSVGHPTVFNNSDPRMIRLFVKWLNEIVKIPKADLKFSIYIHETADAGKALNFWSKILTCEKNKIKVYFKRNSIKTNRKNTGNNYYGLLRITVRRSANLNRRIAAWISHICNYWGMVKRYHGRLWTSSSRFDP